MTNLTLRQNTKKIKHKDNPKIKTYRTPNHNKQNRPLKCRNTTKHQFNFQTKHNFTGLRVLSQQLEHLEGNDFKVNLLWEWENAGLCLLQAWEWFRLGQVVKQGVCPVYM